MNSLVRRMLGRRLPAKAKQRWIVVDTETSGLDPDRDALLAVGAVAVDDQGIRSEDSLELVVQHGGPLDAANVALHGLAPGAVEQGVPPAIALDALRRWVEGAPCIGFHADFDRRVLARAASLAGAAPLAGPWLDLEPVAAALTPDLATGRRGLSLDECLARYAFECPARHNAASDAMATAELLLRLRATAARQGIIGFDGLRTLARQHRWLNAR